jgi:hypothetical protein
MPIDYCETRKVPERKNHYVPLCVPKPGTSVKGGCFVLKPRFLNSSFNAVKRMKTPISAVSVTSQSSDSLSDTFSKEKSTSSNPSASKKTKLKQAILDHIFFPKKRRTEDISQSENIEKPQQEIKNPLSGVEAGKSTEEAKPQETDEIGKAGDEVIETKHGVSRYPNDIGNYVNKSAFTDQEKYNILCNVWKPPPEYQFPINANGRRFRYEWLRIFPWLAYSEKLVGALCINCVLFGPESIGTHNSSKLQRLYKLPLNNWSIAHSRFREHSEKSELHKTETTRAAMFRSFMEQKTTPVDVMLDSIKQQQIEKNRKLLWPIIEAIVLCGRQNISLRRHRDDSQHYLSDDVNPGNFIEILKYGVSCTGQSLEEYFNSTPKNLTYKSKTTQNEIIDICDDLIT